MAIGAYFATAVDVPASYVGVVVPEVEGRAGLMVEGVGIEEARAFGAAGAVIVDADIGSSRLDSEVDRDLDADGQRKWRAVERNGRDRYLTRHFAVVIGNYSTCR